ncbi:MAG: class I SAM-dependent methyltransferase [Phycisphaeraceae bacterium]|nr:class I SAM-dependent methyltransferase [Phycisphaeraceae bacterium]
MDRFDLYERCVTNPGPLAAFLHAVHGTKSAATLREDFAGSGALSRAWAPTYGRAIAVDHDPEPLSRCIGAPGVTTRTADVLACAIKADIIAATNFPLGYWHSRRDLVHYLRLCRARLKPGGIFAADTYGGCDAFVPLRHTQTLRWQGLRIEYTWEQRTANASTGRVLNSLHFRVWTKDAKRAKVFANAFIYDWRLWSIPELRDAMLDAGFSSIEVYDRLGDAIDEQGRVYVRPLDEAAGETPEETFVVYVVARK